MTEREDDLLRFLKLWFSNNSHSPSYTEIAVAIGLGIRSKSAVHRLVHGLESRGLIVLEGAKNSKRAIRLAGDSWQRLGDVVFRLIANAEIKGDGTYSVRPVDFQSLITAYQQAPTKEG